MIKDVLQSLAGILMTAAALVIVLAIIAVSTGITTHNLLSMLALAGTFALIAFGIQWIVQLKPQRDGENQRNQGANDQPQFLFRRRSQRTRTRRSGSYSELL